MCIFGSQPPTVNSRGDVLSQHDQAQLYGDQFSSGMVKNIVDPNNIGLKLTPQKRAEMLFSWLTAGGAPKKVEPGQIFKETEDMAGVKAKGSAGAGVGGLFGAGLMIGDLTPLPQQGGTNSASPMQSGVPYAAVPLPKMIGGG